MGTLDRCARSTSHLVSTLEEFQALGVDFLSYTQQIDSTTPAGKLTFTVLAAIAEFEREIIRERVKAGMAAAKARGKHVGRKRIPMSKQSKARSLRSQGALVPPDRQAVTRLAGNSRELHQELEEGTIDRDENASDGGEGLRRGLQRSEGAAQDAVGRRCGMDRVLLPWCIYLAAFAGVGE